MERRYNETAFTPEEVEKGLHLDLIKYLLDYNSKAEDYYNDIHITSDSYCTIVEWDHIPHDKSYGGEFKYVGEDEIVMKELRLPDNSIVLCYDDNDCNEQLNEFLKEHPSYRQGKYGNWYEEEYEPKEEDYLNLDDLHMEQNENGQ